MSPESVFAQYGTSSDGNVASAPRSEFGFDNHTKDDIELLLDSSQNLYEYGLSLEEAAKSAGKQQQGVSGVLSRMNAQVIKLEQFRGVVPLSEEKYHEMVDLYDALKENVQKIETFYPEFIEGEADVSATEATPDMIAAPESSVAAAPQVAPVTVPVAVNSEESVAEPQSVPTSQPQPPVEPVPGVVSEGDTPVVENRWGEMELPNDNQPVAGIEPAKKLESVPVKIHTSRDTVAQSAGDGAVRWETQTEEEDVVPPTPTTETEPTASPNEDSAFVPRDSVVADLMKQVNENQFYTNEERKKAQEMYEEYHRVVADKESPNILRRSYENLHRFVTNMSRHPAVEYIPERANRILERVKAGATSSNSDVFESVSAMHSMIHRVATDESKSQEDLLTAYQNLERFALENEAEWLTVAGMHPPQSGPDGVAGARALREGLMGARDKHQAFLQYPRKRLLIDKMIRMLGYIPKEGLPEESVEELLRLMRQIDVPRAVGDTGDTVAASVSLEPTAQPDTEAQPTQPKLQTVLGVPVPVGGEVPAMLVRSAQRGLTDLVQTIKDDAEKAVVLTEVEKMIKVLESAKHEILTTEQLSELSHLVQRVRESESTESQAEAQDTVQQETETDKAVPVARKSGKLTIATDSASAGEGKIALTVKNKKDETQSVSQPEVSVPKPTADASVSGVAPESTKQAIAGDVPKTDNATEVPTEEQLKQPHTVVSDPVTDGLSDEEQSALATVEKADPVNTAVPNERPTVLSWQEKRSVNTIVPMQQLIPAYPDFFEQVDVSELDRVIRHEIASHEKQFVDSIDAWVGVERRSAFDFMKDMTLRELDELVGTYGAGERNRFLKETNVVYDALIFWYDQIGELSAHVDTSDDMTFGELLVRFIIENELHNI